MKWRTDLCAFEAKFTFALARLRRSQCRLRCTYLWYTQDERVSFHTRMNTIPFEASDLCLAVFKLQQITISLDLGAHLLERQFVVFRINAGQELSGGEETTGFQLRRYPLHNTSHLRHQVDFSIRTNRSLCPNDDLVRASLVVQCLHKGPQINAVYTLRRSSHRTEQEKQGTATD
jgi:hypothetical protein